MTTFFSKVPVAAAETLGEPVERALEQAPLDPVGLERLLDREPLVRGGARPHRRRILPERAAVEALPPRAEAGGEDLVRKDGEVADDADAELPEHRRAAHADERKALDRHGRHERALVPGVHVDEVRAFGRARGDVAHELVRGDPERDLEPRLAGDLALDPPARLARRSEETVAPRVVDVPLVERGGLDHGAEAPEDAEDRGRRPAEEAPVGRNEHRPAREASRRGRGHAALDAVAARLVGSREDDAARRRPRHDDRLAAQRRVAQPQHRRVEVVRVDVENFPLHRRPPRRAAGRPPSGRFGSSRRGSAPIPRGRPRPGRSRRPQQSKPQSFLLIPITTPITSTPS